jgi:hypothetical protein
MESFTIQGDQERSHHLKKHIDKLLEETQKEGGC